MKTSINTYLSLFLLLTVILSLSVTGCKGPAGADGPQGPEGPTGPVGPAGENGSVMLAGNGAPADDLGNFGDYYLDLSTSELYGPKTEENLWGTPINLSGQDGADGQDGSQIFSGTTAPDASLGNVGDYYLNTATFDLYGPKTASGWGTPINLQGNAEVIYSSWTAIDSWSTDLPRFKYQRFPDRILTPGQIEGAAIMVYHKKITEFSGTIIRQLSYSVLNLTTGSTDIYYGAWVQGNGINLRIQSFGRDIVAEEYLGPESEFRYVIIPGNIPAKINPESFQDYNLLRKYFGIRDENTSHPLRLE